MKRIPNTTLWTDGEGEYRRLPNGEFERVDYPEDSTELNIIDSGEIEAIAVKGNS